MAQLYSNENFPQPVVQALRRLGHDVLTVLEAGKAEQAIADDLVLMFASSIGRAVLTLNRKHFIRLHQVQCSPTMRASSSVLLTQISSDKQHGFISR